MNMHVRKGDLSAEEVANLVNGKVCNNCSLVCASINGLNQHHSRSNCANRNSRNNLISNNDENNIINVENNDNDFNPQNIGINAIDHKS